MGYGNPMVSAARYEFIGRPLSTGLTLTSGSSGYGSLATLGTNSFDYDGVYIFLNYNNSGARMRFSFTYNNSGTDEPLVTDLFADTQIVSAAMGPFIPVAVPKNSIIKGKMHSVGGSNAVNVVLQGMQGDSRQLRGFRLSLHWRQNLELKPGMRQDNRER